MVIEGTLLAKNLSSIEVLVQYTYWLLYSTYNIYIFLNMFVYFHTLPSGPEIAKFCTASSYPQLPMAVTEA